MSVQEAATARAAPRAHALPWLFLSYVVLALVAAAPRVLDLGQFVTEDEANFWLRRSEIFLEALETGNFGAMAISDHPGVTTMWLGSAGILLRRALEALGLLQNETYPTMLALMRLPAAIAHTLAILLGYGMLRRMLPGVTALLAALLWAADPFVIAYSRVLHVDGLLATFAMLSVLAACLHWHHGRQGWTLALSGVCAGLAILSKSPGFALLPVAGGVALAAAWRERGTRGIWRKEAARLLAWGAICVATVLVLWPVLLVSPLQAYEQIRIGVVVEGAQPHQLGNFFLGRQDDVPGPLFYPLTIALRLTPWTLLGLLLAPWAWRRARGATRRDLLVLAGYALLFTAAMTVFPKKFNRYLVPAFPALDVLAAVGLAWGAERLAGLRAGARRWRAGLLSGVALAAVVNAAYWHPYQIAAFNQALGGARVGARAFMVGWGEGFEQVAAWLNQQPDITGVLTVNTLTATLQPYLRPGAQAVTAEATLPEKAGYVVVFVRNVQAGPPLPPLDQFYGKAEPLHTVRIHGVEYAWIYQAPPPVARSLAVDFGPAIHLRGLTPSGAARRGETLGLRLSWTAKQRPAQDYMLFAHLLGPDGERYAGIDLPYATSQWQPGRYELTEAPLVVPADAPAGRYQVMIGLYDPATGQRLPLGAQAADPALDGPDALLLYEFALD